MVGNGKGLQKHHLGSPILYFATKSLFLDNILHVLHIKIIYYLYINLLEKIMFVLSFTLLFSMSRINPQNLSYPKARVIMVSFLCIICPSFLVVQQCNFLAMLPLINAIHAQVNSPSKLFFKLYLSIIQLVQINFLIKYVPFVSLARAVDLIFICLNLFRRVHYQICSFYMYGVILPKFLLVKIFIIFVLWIIILNIFVYF